jgi:hypothetical protein
MAGYDEEVPQQGQLSASATGYGYDHQCENDALAGDPVRPPGKLLITAHFKLDCRPD